MQPLNQHPFNADLNVLAISSLDTVQCALMLHCTDPTGQIFHLRLAFYWFSERPKLDTSQAEFNGDKTEGALIVRRHTNQLRDLLAREYQRLIASGAVPQKYLHRSDGRDSTLPSQRSKLLSKPNIQK